MIKKINFFFKICFLINVFSGLHSQNIRDPFNYSTTLSVSSEKIEIEYSKSYGPKLMAITKYKKGYGAILQHLNNQEVVFKDDIVWGYKVLEISNNNIILLKENLKLVLNY